MSPRPARRACGHAEMARGCGGCDPGAVEFVILDDGTRRAFDPLVDLGHPSAETT